MMGRFPSAVLEAARNSGAAPLAGSSGTSTPSLDITALRTPLTSLAFRPAHVNSALSALESAVTRLQSSGPSSTNTDPFVLSLSMLSPLEATIEWLLLHLPEDDLPVRYRTTASSSDFVTGASKGGAVKGWLIDKLVKQAGFPRKVVESVLAEEVSESEALDTLGTRLCGWNIQEPTPINGFGHTNGDDSKVRDVAREEEKLALEALLGDRLRQISPTEFTIEISSTSSSDIVNLHIVFDHTSPYPSALQSTTPPAFFISSATVPSYMRLHLHASLLKQFRDPERGDLRSVLESGQGGAVFSMIEYLEEILPNILEEPPDIGEVTRHVVPQPEKAMEDIRPQKRTEKIQKRVARKRVVTKEDHDKVKERQRRMRQDPEYEGMMDVRRKLPAWQERERINGLLEQNRVLVVVGETGCGKR